jgi:hypothetical protein
MTQRALSIKAKADAIAAGLKTYLGKPCAKHGEQLRWVSTGSCLVCNTEGLKPYRERNKEALVETRRQWDKKNPIKAMLQRARRRARDMNIEFNLTAKDIVIPDICPALGIKLLRGNSDQDSSPSLDRIDNDKGYVVGNIVVVSFRANRMKSNSTVGELKRLVEFYEQV